MLVLADALRCKGDVDRNGIGALLHVNLRSALFRHEAQGAIDLVFLMPRVTMSSLKDGEEQLQRDLGVVQVGDRWVPHSVSREIPAI
jgi:hypothetical protein